MWKSKQGSKSKKPNEKDLRKAHEKETKFTEHGAAAKKSGQSTLPEETVPPGRQAWTESSSGAEASASDHKQEEKKGFRKFSLSKSRRTDKNKPPTHVATSPPKKQSKHPVQSIANSPVSPDDANLRTSPTYHSPEGQHDELKELPEMVKYHFPGSVHLASQTLFCSSANCFQCLACTWILEVISTANEKGSGLGDYYAYMSIV